MPSPLQQLADDSLRAAGVEVWLKREDLIHPEVPGNKWRKLKYNLAEAAKRGDRTLLTFGGAYSNHIRAVAAAGRTCGLSTIGIIRGEEHLPLNPSLEYAAQQGMRLSYLNREEYRRKADPEVIESLGHSFGSFYLLPEGGSNELAVRGMRGDPGRDPRGLRRDLLSVRDWRDAGRDRCGLATGAAGRRILCSQGGRFP